MHGSQLAAGVFLAAGLLMAAGTYAGQDADDGFNPNANNPVYTLAVQPDGKILVGGLFGTIGGGARTRVARILSNGRLDTSFDPGIIAGTAVSISVYALALQSDGKVVISGEFDEVADQERMNIARLNADGSLDAAFNPGANSTAYALKIQPDGKIIVGGLFSSLGGQAKKCIGRLNADGSLDTAFNPTTDGIILSIALQADGKIVVGGWFTLMDNQPRQSIARLNADGTLDSTFLQTNSANDDVHCDVQCLAIQADGKIIIGGDFAAIDGQERNNIARLNADGSLDTTFDPNANNPVWNLDVQTDGKIIIGGAFTKIGDVDRKFIARLNADGSLDTDFDPTAGNSVTVSAIQPDGKIIVGGWFVTLGNVTRKNIGRLYPDGSLDDNFLDAAADPALGASDTVYAMAQQPDGQLIVGGLFHQLSGVDRNRIGRFGVDGTLDAAFNPNAEASIRTIAIQADGKILIGGFFTQLDVAEYKYIARLDSVGNPEAGFNPKLDGGAVRCIAPQPDGKIIIAGEFTEIDVTDCLRIGRLNSDGTLDGTFTVPSGADGIIYSALLQSDGKIVVGGTFTHLGGEARNHIGRLNSDGSLDTTFDPNVNDGSVYTLALQADGKILLGGTFTAIGVDAVDCQRIGRLNSNGTLDASFVVPSGANLSVRSMAIQTDGKILVSGAFTQIGGLDLSRIARLNSNGSVDTDFAPPDGANNTVHSLVLQPDGKVIAGGDFTQLTGHNRNHIGRLSTVAPAIQNLALDSSATAISWTRTGNGPELDTVVFGQSLDGTTWSTLGAGSRLTNGWQITGLTLPLSTNFYLRARGFYRCGYFNNSVSICESVRLIYLTPGVYQVSADYDGDQLADPTVYDEATGTWRVKFSIAEHQLFEFPALLGGPGWLPVAADFDGDRLADPGVLQAATGNWQVKFSIAEYQLFEFSALLGGPGWLPVAYDCDNDRMADPGVYEQATGTWQFKLSGSDYAPLTLTNWLGGFGYTPAIGDYDGDANGDPGVYQETTGNWQIRFSTQSYLNIFQADAFVGGPGYNAAAADYDGDGITDPSVFQSSTGDWKVRLSINDYNEVDLPEFLK